jgi:type II secretory pathway pseudopilin PulG
MLTMRRAGKRGISVIEIVIGSAIVASVLLGLVTAYNFSVRALIRNTKIVQASFLAEEGFEVLRMLRDSGWTANIAPLVSGTSYYLTFSSGAWSTTITPQYLNNFERVVTLSDVNRDSNDDIADVGTLDPDTKQTTVTVSWWTGAATTSKMVTGYLTDLFDN